MYTYNIKHVSFEDVASCCVALNVIFHLKVRTLFEQSTEALVYFFYFFSFFSEKDE